MLSEIQKMGMTFQPPRLFIYGGAGQGKSTVASQSPSPIFIPTEDGLSQIVCDSFPLSKTFSQFMGYLSELTDTSKHNYKTVVIDTVDWLEKLIFDDVCANYGVKDINDVGKGYGKGYTIALTYWDKVKSLLQRLRDQSMAIVFISHTTTKTIKFPETGELTQYIPKINTRAKDLLCEWCDAVLFVTRRYGAEKGAKSGGELVFKTQSTEWCYAKNRYNLPEMLPLSWNALAECIKSDIESRRANHQEKEEE